jgi:hypothetical protein
MTRTTHLLLATLAAALWTGTVQAQSERTQERGPLDFWQAGPWPGLGEPTMNPRGSDWANESPRTVFEWADEGDARQGFQPSVEVAPQPRLPTTAQGGFASDVGAPLDAIGILDWAESAPAAPLQGDTPAGTWEGTAGATASEEPSSPILADDPIVATPLPQPGQTAPTLPESDPSAQALSKPPTGPVPLPGSRADAAFDVARIDALLNGIAVDPPAPLAQDCEAWTSVTQASPSSASVLIEIACLANETVYLQLGDNAPETVALDVYGAAQRVLGTTGAIHPMTLRRAHDGALLARQDTPDQPPTVYAP